MNPKRATVAESTAAAQETRPMLVVDGNQEKEGIADVLRILAERARRKNEMIAVGANLSEQAEEAGFAPEHLRIIDSPGEIARGLKDEGHTAGLVICLGGDGALLHIIRHYHQFDLPFLGVNLGSVGFNASVSPGQLDATLDAFERGQANIAQRLALWAQHRRDGQLLAESIAVNDVVIQRDPSSRMLEVQLHQNGHRVLGFHADGLVIATPTGSTAYNLSTGGPVLEPSLRVIAVTGIAPHTLTHRPLVLPPDPLQLTAYCKRGTHQGLITVDGQEVWVLKHGDRVEIAAYPQSIRLVNPEGYDYYDTLRQKLNWAEPIRPLGQ